MLLCENGVSLPVDIFEDHILPFLERCSFNRVSEVSKASNELTKQLVPPWPRRLVSKNHLCRMRSLAFSHGGTKVVCGCTDGNVRIWDVWMGALPAFLAHWPDEAVTSVAFANTSDNLLASASSDNTIQILTLSSCEPERKIAKQRQIHDAYVSCIRFGRDDQTLFAGHVNSESIHMWDLQGGKLLRRFNGSLARISSLSLSDDGAFLASAAYSDESGSNSVRIWSTSDLTHKSHCGGFQNAIGWSRRDKSSLVIASACGPESIEIWSTDVTGETSTKREFPNNFPHELVVSGEGRYVASVDNFQSIKVWDLWSGSNEVFTFTEESVCSLRGLAFCPSERENTDNFTVAAIARKQNMILVCQNLDHFSRRQTSLSSRASKPA